MRRSILGAAAILALGAALLMRGGARPELGAPGGGRPNVLVVSIDTLRPDRLGSYGHPGAATPHLDGLAGRGLRFAEATTVVPLTLPAHASLFTGTFPGHHGVRDNGGFYLGDEHVTLAETLRDHGYRTGGFVGAFVLDSRWGIHQGFERYFDDFDLSKYDGRGLDAVQRPGDEVVLRALAWLDEDKARPFFAWVHLYDPHTPYAAPEPFRSRFPADATGAYDAEVAFSDSLVGRLLDHLRSDGRLERTLVVAVGDHGESLGDHREQTHGFFVYDATIQIPLIVAGPAVPARVVPDQVRIVDVMPTVLELAGVPPPAAVQGKSLLPLARGERLELVGLSESFYPRYHYGWSELTAVRDGRYKLIRAPRRELYDLRTDPGETNDLAARDPVRAEALERALVDAVERVTTAAGQRKPQAIDPEAEERLQALGYLGGSVSQRNLEDRPRGDPKDKIVLYNLLKRAGQASVEGRIDEAIALASEAIATDPEIIEAHSLLGNFHSKAKRYEAAVAAYRGALARDPEHQGATFSLALAYKTMGRLADAEAGFERAQKLDPRGTKPLWQIADIRMRKGEFAGAARVLEEGLSRKVDRPVFLLKLAECRIEMQEYAPAEAALREALSLRPDLATARYNLALVREAAGDVRGAIAEYEGELRQNPTAHRASFNLARLFLAGGRAPEAAARFRDAVAAEPGFGTGHLYLAKALLDLGDLKGAQDAARKGLASKPEAKTAPLGHYVLADVYSRLGRPREAAREVAAARRLERGG